MTRISRAAMAAVRADRSPAAKADNRIASRNGPRGSRKWKHRCTAKDIRKRQEATEETLHADSKPESSHADPTAAHGLSTSTATPPAADPSIDGLANENTFLQLLVAQIKNQDPTNPTDSVQFLSQLAQFSQLEQLIGIRQELQPPASSTGTTDPNSGTTATTGTTN